MGMTARCSIILEEAKDVFAVPYDAIHENQDGTNVIYVEEMPDQDVQEREITEESGNTQDSNGYKEIEVTKGMESDYYVEISGDGFQRVCVLLFLQIVIFQMEMKTIDRMQMA